MEEKKQVSFWRISDYYLKSIWDLQLKFGELMYESKYQEAYRLLTNILMFTNPYITPIRDQIDQQEKVAVKMFTPEFNAKLSRAKTNEERMVCLLTTQESVGALYNINTLVINQLDDFDCLLSRVGKSDKLEEFRNMGI